MTPPNGGDRSPHRGHLSRGEQRRSIHRTATLLGRPDTFNAEYVALTQLHAGALITLDPQLAHAVKDLVAVASIESLY